MKNKKVMVVKASEAEGYAPPGHAGTWNLRFIGPNNGSERIEVILGEMTSEGVADLHTHEDFDQVNYLLEGKMKTVSDGVDYYQEPGDLCFIPAGAPHEAFSIASKSKFILIYTPPRQKKQR